MTPYKEERPWGDFVRYTHNEKSTVKVITVKEGGELSLQFHHNRDEFWRILSDSGIVKIDGKEIEAKKDSEYFIPKGTTHTAKGPIQFLEISFGYFDESDIVRLSDPYHRS